MTTLPRLIPSREKSAMSTPSPRHDGRGSVQTLFYRYDSPTLVPLSLFTIGLGEVDACMIVGTLVLLFMVDTKASLELVEAARRRSWSVPFPIACCCWMVHRAKKKGGPKGKLLAGNSTTNSDVKANFKFKFNCEKRKWREDKMDEKAGTLTDDERPMMVIFDDE